VRVRSCDRRLEEATGKRTLSFLFRRSAISVAVTAIFVFDACMDQNLSNSFSCALCSFIFKVNFKEYIRDLHDIYDLYTVDDTDDSITPNLPPVVDGR